MPFPNPDTQFKPGNKASPGRPKGRSVTARLRDLLDAVEIGGRPLPDGKQVADLLAEVIVRNALKGDHRYVATVLDRVEGRVGDDRAERDERERKPQIVIPGLAPVDEG